MSSLGKQGYIHKISLETTKRQNHNNRKDSNERKQLLMAEHVSCHHGQAKIYPQYKHVTRNYEMSKPPRLKESKERKQHLMAHREGVGLISSSIKEK